MDYKKKLVERSLINKIIYLMQNFPAVALIGARQVGKSTLLKSIYPKAKYFDLEDDQDFELAENDSSVIFHDHSKPILFDEAQLSVNLFKSLRVEIDKTKKNGQFLISGSSSPELLGNISETLAGRIAIVEVPGFNLSESFNTKPSLLMKNISNLEALKKLKTVNNPKNIFQSCLFGGYPQPLLNRNSLKYVDTWFDSYYKTYLERDVRSLFPKLKLNSYKHFIKMMGRSNGEIINYSDFSKSLDVSQPTIKNYFEIANGTFVWRNIPSYTKNSKKTVIKMPKGQLRDSGLLCFLLNINSTEELINHVQFGRIWESFIIEQLIKMANLEFSKLNYYYFRTKAKAEIDLILEGRFGTIPIEIKSGIKTNKNQILTLKNFIIDNNCPLAIVVNRGEEIKMLAEKIIQIPISYI